jgi:predicted chitinase
MADTTVTLDRIRSLAPRAHSLYLAAFDRADAILAGRGVAASPLRIAHFMAQVLHETDDLTVTIESTNYSAARLVEIFPRHFTAAEAERYAHRPRDIAERAYGGRMGNRPEGAGDGATYVGRGLLQITGRDAYRRYGARLGIPLERRPELALSPEWALKIAVAEWTASGRNGLGCDELADRDDLENVTRAINGGVIGLASRAEKLVRTKRIWLDGGPTPTA